MKRLMDETVFTGFVTAWRLATWPTSRSPSLVQATTDGVVREPSALGMTTGSPPSITATTEFVVPRSIPITLAIPVVLALSLRSLTLLIPCSPPGPAPRANGLGCGSEGCKPYAGREGAFRAMFTTY